MPRIAVLGAGVMGTALAMVAAHHESNEVLLVGTLLDDPIIDALHSAKPHPTLSVPVPERIRAIHDRSADAAALAGIDALVLAVSSPGVDWAVNKLARVGVSGVPMALATKGLVPDTQALTPPLTYADALPSHLWPAGESLVGIGGPCIARELALRIPTQVVYAARYRPGAERFRQWLQCPYYKVSLSDDVVGVEACAALKNFLCIGVSAMLSRYEIEGRSAKNPVAAVFNQAVHEMALLSAWVAESTGVAEFPPGSRPTAFDVAGLADLHVTVGGGRNSRLGRHLGGAQPLSAILSGPMKDVTVEGVDTGRALAPAFRHACAQGHLSPDQLPLTRALLDCIVDDAPFEISLYALP